MTDVEFLDGVRAQPDYLAASQAAVRAALRDVDTAVIRRGSTVVMGIGASGHAGVTCTAQLRAHGARAFTVSAGESPGGTADCYIGVSYSGRSTETVRTLGMLEGTPRIAVTGNPDAPLSGVVDQLIPLGRRTDTAVSTLSYTATVQALGLLVDDAYARPSRAWRQVPDAAGAVLADPTHADRIATVFAEVSGVDVVGAGHRFGSAGAAALLLREAAHLPAAGYATREYLHGPLEVAGPGHGALIFGSGRAARLAERLAEWGTPTVLITEDASLRTEPGGPVVIRLPALPEPVGRVLDVLPVQLAAAELARRRDLPIALRHMPADTKLAPGDRVPDAAC